MNWRRNPRYTELIKPCRSIDTLLDIEYRYDHGEFYNGRESYDGESFDFSRALFTVYAIRGALAAMERELDEYEFGTRFYFHADTYYYAIIFGRAECLDFALRNSDPYILQRNWRIIPLCIIKGQFECLKVAMKYDVMCGYYSRTTEVHETCVNPYFYVYTDVNSIKLLHKKTKCFRILREARLRHFRIRRRFEIDFPNYVNNVLWEIFRIYARQRMIVSYWMQITGESTCAPNGVGRKRHLEEFVKEF